MSAQHSNPWLIRLKPYAQPSLPRSIWQLINSLTPYVFVNVLMLLIVNSGLSWWLLLPLSVIGGLLMVRLFILFHDCTHLSFFRSKRANSLWGHFLGVLTYTPYHTWQHEHNIHHGSVGDLDRRGMGDVWTLTVDEYLKSSRSRRFLYRLYRNPFFLFIVAPFFLFGLLNRFPRRQVRPKEQVSYWVTNIGLILLFGLFWAFGHWYSFLLIQLPQLFFASVAGVWLFFVQHQFEEVYWSKHEEWDLVKAALEGSSFYKLNPVLNWLTGSIGYHHIHHLNSRIPNYYLKACFKEMADLQTQREITLLSSFRLALLQLYDENAKRMITFKALRRRQSVQS